MPKEKHIKNYFCGICIEGQKVNVLCEGCNERIWIDHNGKRIEEK